MSLKQICAQYLLLRGGGGLSHTSFLNMSWLEQTLWKIAKGNISMLPYFGNACHSYP